MPPRVSSIEPRGRITGFVDNVFDQRRGKRASVIAPGVSPQNPVSLPRGHKRPRISNDTGQGKSLGSLSQARELLASRTPDPPVQRINKSGSVTWWRVKCRQLSPVRSQGYRAK